MIATELALALDPARMSERAGVVPDDWQADALRSGSSRMLLNCSRQSGKSLTTGIIAVHETLYRPKSLVLMLSPSLRQSSELFRKALTIYRTLGRPVPADTENKLSLELANASRIVSLPGNETTIRGFSGATLILVDEAARVPDSLYYSVRPMLATSGGRLIALSTPFGRRGWFSAAWHGHEDWERYEIPATECPRITPEFLEEERRTLGSWWYQQEYECAFLDPETAAFRSIDIEAMVQEDVELWNLPSLSA